MVQQEKTFYLNGGRTFSTLKGLARELMKMPVEVYNHHVDHSRNDFAAWAKHSLNKEQLGKRIDGQISKIELELEVLRHLVHEEKTSKKKVSNSKKKSSVKKAKK